jgi:hypothetical protein
MNILKEAISSIYPKGNPPPPSSSPSTTTLMSCIIGFVATTVIVSISVYRATQPMFSETMNRVCALGDFKRNKKQLPYTLDVFFMLPMALGPPIPVTRIVVKKQFTSKTKPLLISMSFYGLFERHFVYKKEDVTTDWIVQRSFGFLNKLWAKHEWFVPQYRVMRLTDSTGIIELVPGTHNTSVLKEKHLEREKAIPSLVGGIVACFVLGIRDRHFDNILVRDHDGAFVHIDFGHVFRKSSMMLGTRVCIPPICFEDPMRKKRIKNSCVQAYEIAIGKDKGTRFEKFVLDTIRSLPPLPRRQQEDEAVLELLTSKTTFATTNTSTDDENQQDGGRDRSSSWTAALFGERKEGETEMQTKDRLVKRVQEYFQKSGCLMETNFEKHVKVFAKMRLKNFFHQIAHGKGDHM